MKVTIDKTGQLIWAIANMEAVLAGATSIHPVHFLLGILKLMDPGVVKRAADLGLSTEESTKLAQSVANAKHYLELGDKRITRLRRAIRLRARKGRQIDPTAELALLHRDDASRKVFAHAIERAENQHRKTISLEHLLESLFETGSISLKDLRDFSKPSSDGARWSIE